MTKGKVAVITDAASPGFTFPLWHAYYSEQFGADNLFVYTYNGAAENFQQFRCGKIVEMDGRYNDDVRLDVITNATNTLLDDYEIVIHVDVDEMLVVDPARWSSLSAYLSAWDGDYITGRGFDIIQGSDETPIDFGKKILGQRRVAFALTALNKTSVTRVPLTWGRGFHYCSKQPKLSDLILFHLKRVDINCQKSWGQYMLGNALPGSFEAKYYESDISYIDPFIDHRRNSPCVNGGQALDRADFNANFYSLITYNEASGIYEGPYIIESTNVIIPDRFRNIF